jgi:hypothetical protein
MRRRTLTAGSASAAIREGDVKHSARQRLSVMTAVKRLRGRARRHSFGVRVRWSTEVVTCGLITRFTILSDSLSAIEAVEVGRCRSRPNLFNDALEAMSKADAETTLVWVPSHIGIEGNERPIVLQTRHSILPS